MLLRAVGALQALRPLTLFDKPPRLLPQRRLGVCIVRHGLEGGLCLGCFALRLVADAEGVLQQWVVRIGPQRKRRGDTELSRS